jgi:hypothetical protein
MVISNASPAGERRAEAVIPPVLGAIGLVAIVVGTFLPWLRSGTQDRNSYEAGGAVRRLLGTTGAVDHLLGLWPLVGVACAAAIALFLFGLHTFGTIVAGLSALAAGAAGVGALATTGTTVAEVTLIGPLVTLLGATLVALAVLLRALSAVVLPRRMEG